MNIKFIVRVIAELQKNLGRPITILQVSKKSGLSYNATNRTVHFLAKEGVINLIKIGPSLVVEINDNSKAKGFIALAEAYEEK